MVSRSGVDPPLAGGPQTGVSPSWACISRALQAEHSQRILLRSIIMSLSLPFGIDPSAKFVRWRASPQPRIACGASHTTDPSWISKRRTHRIAHCRLDG